MKTCFIDVSDMLLFGIRNDGPTAAAQPRLDGGRDVTRGGVTPKATTNMTTFLRDPQGLKAKSNETLPMAAVRRPMSANAEGRSRALQLLFRAGEKAARDARKGLQFTVETDPTKGHRPAIKALIVNSARRAELSALGHQ